MYRLIRAKQTDPETIKNMSLGLLAKNRPPQFDDECPVCHLAVEDGLALGFIMAAEDPSTVVGDAEKPTLRITGLWLAELPTEKFSEALEFMIRATIINARAEGIYERIVIAPADEYVGQFEEWGFSEVETEEGGIDRSNLLEYLLDCCQGYCPFCRAC